MKIASAYASGTSEEIASALCASLDGALNEAALVVFFAHIDLDGRAIGAALRARAGGASVIGCSANGAYANGGYGKLGASAITIPRAFASRAAATLANVGDGVESGIVAASERLAKSLGRSLRSLPHERSVGLALLEGAKQREELINEALGDVAPALRFVGGSAGDDIRFARTWAYCDGELAHDGCALAVLETDQPFAVLQACNFAPSGRVATITGVDPGSRILREIDGIPAARFYADLCGKPVSELGFADFLERPLGLMIDGKAWLRSPVRVEGEGLLFACSVVEGARLDLMRPGDLVDDTRGQLAALQEELGGVVDGAIFFNCAYRMIEAQVRGSEARYHEVLSSIRHAGMHTNGESYLGHINQTLTGLAFRISS